MNDIFISYKVHNRKTAIEYYKKLKALDYQVWFDQLVPKGADWKETIAKQIADSHLVICLLSKECLLDDWVLYQIDTAKFYHKDIFYVTLDDTPWQEHPEYRVSPTTYKSLDDLPIRKWLSNIETPSLDEEPLKEESNNSEESFKEVTLTKEEVVEEGYIREESIGEVTLTKEENIEEKSIDEEALEKETFTKEEESFEEVILTKEEVVEESYIREESIGEVTLTKEENIEEKSIDEETLEKDAFTKEDAEDALKGCPLVHQLEEVKDSIKEPIKEESLEAELPQEESTPKDRPEESKKKKKEKHKKEKAEKKKKRIFKTILNISFMVIITVLAFLFSGVKILNISLDYRYGCILLGITLLLILSYVHKRVVYIIQSLLAIGLLCVTIFLVPPYYISSVSINSMVFLLFYIFAIGLRYSKMNVWLALLVSLFYAVLFTALDATIVILIDHFFDFDCTWISIIGLVAFLAYKYWSLRNDFK